MAGLTLTIITSKATSLNYGETIGNVSILKKISLADNTQITYVSDKALKYDIKRKGKEEKQWQLLDIKVKEIVSNSAKDNILDVDNFAKELIKNYEEFDLFGGLFTNISTGDSKKKELKLSNNVDSVKRTSTVKLTYAFSVSPFNGDMNFLNNIDAYERYIKHLENKANQSIANSEEHTSHYIYTITVDLDRIGIWENTEGQQENVLDNQQKAKRVSDLIDIVFTLNRQIRGRWEDLSPVFVVGGIFETKHPFFIKAVDVREANGKLILDIKRLKESIEFAGENTILGIHSGTFLNEEDIRKELSVKSLKETLDYLKKKVGEHYGVSKV